MIGTEYGEISIATQKNRLKQSSDIKTGKLMKRANKRLSEKVFIPEEYTNHTNIITEAYLYIQKGYSIKEILYSLVLNLTQNVKNIYLDKEITSWDIKSERIIEKIRNFIIQGNKEDVLGGVYQSLLTEGEKNKKGSYYTPDSIVKNQIDKHFVDGMKFLDPCCGAGQYLIHIPTSDPKNIWGADLDEIAVKVARINIMIKYSNVNFEPNIYHNDSLISNDGLFNNSILQEESFDIIATNPPWGSKIENIYTGYSVKSGEAFSHFIEKGLKLLKKGGILTYILPESLLHVKVHEDIRAVILQYNILSIHELGRVFTGVFTPAIRIDIKKEKEDGAIDIYGDKTFSIQQSTFLSNTNLIFSIHIDDDDFSLIEKVYAREKIFLNNTNADRALGIVTGDNSTYISESEKEGYIPVYTGKEVAPYTLKKVNKFLLYKPNAYQQIAPLCRYQANPKLIYKFISNKLVFSLDLVGVYTLNSANIIIPKLDYPIKVIIALFNSELYQKIFQKKFHSIKVLKSHIQELPLPILSQNIYTHIEKYIDDIMMGKKEKIGLDTYIFNLLTT